ncbi:MAG: DUF4783 domain-containing protein [Bacteroidetes bacterium]|jgi:hypothetical protein|nr:DUF4783 domain-containing protein [Bacteroidota bacterium]
MKNIINTFLILLLLFLHINIRAAIPGALTSAFKNGNSNELANYFHSNIELVINGKEGIYSKNQAEQIVQRFFINHIPSSFEIVHEGGKESSKYAIGSLKTNNGVFRVYFLIKFVNDKPYIHQLRIEADND